MATKNYYNDGYISGTSAERLAGTLPTDCPINTLFVELDTGDVYYWNGEQWAPFGGGGGEK